MLAPFHNPNLGAFAPPYSCNESGRARDPPEPPLRLFSCFCGVRGFLSSPLALSVFASLREIILSFSPTIRETEISRFPLRISSDLLIGTLKRSATEDCGAKKGRNLL